MRRLREFALNKAVIRFLARDVDAYDEDRHVEII
jgi:hypothetical protein